VNLFVKEVIHSKGRTIIHKVAECCDTESKDRIFSADSEGHSGM
jgi:hypothetical protein